MSGETREIAERIVRNAGSFDNHGAIVIARRGPLTKAIDKALRDRDERAAKIAADFDDWVWCTCGECKAYAGSHAVKIEPSMERLATAIRNGVVDAK